MRTGPPTTSSVRKTLVKVTSLPQLLTMPLNRIETALLLQRATRLVLHSEVTKMHGAHMTSPPASALARGKTTAPAMTARIEIFDGLHIGYRFQRQRLCR